MPGIGAVMTGLVKMARIVNRAILLSSSSLGLPGELSPLNNEPELNGLMPNHATSRCCMVYHRLFSHEPSSIFTTRAASPSSAVSTLVPVILVLAV